MQNITDIADCIVLFFFIKYTINIIKRKCLRIFIHPLLARHSLVYSNGSVNFPLREIYGPFKSAKISSFCNGTSFIFPKRESSLCQAI